MNENRLREQSPSAVLKAPAFLDIGGLGGARYRDLLFFDLGEYEGAKIKKATLSLYWYYPAGVSRLENTIVEVYRPCLSCSLRAVLSFETRGKCFSWGRINNNQRYKRESISDINVRIKYGKI